MTDQDTKAAYLSAAHRLMQEIAAGGLRMGLSHGMLETALRDATLEAAFSQFERSGAKVTVSSLHVATGIHRREISRWIKERAHEPNTVRPTTDSPSARVVTRWSSNRRYRDPQGQPLVLPMAKHSDGPSFAQLVEEIGPEVRAKSVLEGLIAAGLVENLQDGTYRLKSAAFLPEANSRESIEFLSANVGDHLSAAIHNISAAPDHRYFERAMFNPEVSPAQVQVLRDALSVSAMALLADMGELSEKTPDEAEVPNEAARRVRIGVYFYQDEVDV
ncbi:MAG: hypothetical protein CME01_07010 [Geminicoccus sp.]|nr:hypothetical protein [Geminicoccus sp.]